MPEQPDQSKAKLPEEKTEEDKPQQPAIKLKDLANYRDPMGGLGSDHQSSKEAHDR